MGLLKKSKPFNELMQPLRALAEQYPRFALACSGGLDSMALLHAAHQAGLNPLVLHVDHGIHADSAQWAQEVHSRAQTLGLEFAVHRASGLTAGMANLENAARLARQQGLLSLAKAQGAGCVLLAHHANDQAETVLLNLLRGTGLNGVGMPPHRSVQGVAWVRPWLDIPKSTLLAYAQAQGLNWVDDPSNLDEALRRNAVRHSLWPVLLAVEPRALPSLLRFSKIATEAAQNERTLAARWVAEFIRPQNSNDEASGQRIAWHEMVKNQAVQVQMALLRAWLAHLGCRSPTQARAEAMLKQLNAKTGSGVRCSHEGWIFAFDGKTLVAQVQASVAA